MRPVRVWVREVHGARAMRPLYMPAHAFHKAPPLQPAARLCVSKYCSGASAERTGAIRGRVTSEAAESLRGRAVDSYQQRNQYLALWRSPWCVKAVTPEPWPGCQSAVTHMGEYGTTCKTVGRAKFTLTNVYRVRAGAVASKSREYPVIGLRHILLRRTDCASLCLAMLMVFAVSCAHGVR